MSVRPITVSEEQYAKGHPFVNIFAVFGGLQGLMIYSHRTRIPINQNLFAHPGSFARFAFFVGGGFIAGGLAGMVLFHDKTLLRLYYSHQNDKHLLTDSQKSSDY